MYQKYEVEIQKREALHAEYDKRANIVGIFKLAWVVMSGYTLYNAWTNHFPSKLIFLLCAEVAIFIIACVYHRKIFEQVAYEAGLIDIAKKNLCRLSGEWRAFSDIGEEFIDYHHDYGTDLDIVGKYSLFQFLNSTHTYYGRSRLGQDLLNPHYSQKDLQVRQEAITELSNNYSWSSHIEYLFSKIGIDTSFPKLISELKCKNNFIKSKFLKLLLDVSRMLTGGTVLFSLLTKDSLGIAIAYSLILFQLLLWGIGFFKANRYVGIMKNLPYKMEGYTDVINDILQQAFASDKLKELKSILLSAKEAIQDLSKISSNISQRQNGIACLILNALWLWDYKNAVDLDRWKQKYGASVEIWFSALGELESLLSFANLPRNCSVTCVPKVSMQKNEILAKNLGHPLLNNQHRVCNDLEINNNIVIISGSNMSGKTTFMRTVGINMVLASAGSYVCAEKMTFSIMKIMTSMRIADELTEGISTFYAELKRIKKIVDVAQVDNHQLFLIDEIFRGTNSVDRLKGAEGVLEKLYTLGVCGIITTHDLEVCKLENAYKRITNYCFYEHYLNGELHFDYTMKKGVSKTTNAQYLLKKVGII
jgi:hypothetical protein